MPLSIGDHRLGAILLQLQVLTEPELQVAQAQLDHGGGRLLDVLVHQKILTEEQIAQAIEVEMGYPIVDFSVIKPDPLALAKLNHLQAAQFEALPFALDQDVLSVALVEPLNIALLESLVAVTGCQIEPNQILGQSFPTLLQQYYLGGVESKAAQVLTLDQERMVDELLLVQRPGADELDSVLFSSSASSETLPAQIEKLGLMSEVERSRFLATDLGLSLILDQSWLVVEQEAANFFSRLDSIRFQAVPIAVDADRIVFLSAEPRLRAEVQKLFTRQVQMVVTMPSEITLLIERTYTHTNRLGDKLLEHEAVTREHLVEALKVVRSKAGTRLLGEVLVELGYVSSQIIEGILETEDSEKIQLDNEPISSEQAQEETLARTLSIMLGYEYINPRFYTPDARLTSLIPEFFARRYSVFPYSRHGDELHVLMKEPRNLNLIDELRIVTQLQVKPIVGIEKEIKALIERFYVS
jgi:type IV pilus assembly protein PilB